MRQKNESAGSQWATPGRRAALVLATGAFAFSALAAGEAAGAVTPPQGATVTVVATPKGHVLSYGNTLYTLKPTAISCGKKCLAIWPPAVLPQGVTQPQAGTGVSASKLHTVKVAGVGNQLTYGGKKLYWYYHDTASGQVKGNIKDKWGKWTAAVIGKAPSGSGSSSNSGSNAGSGGVSF